MFDFDPSDYMDNLEEIITHSKKYSNEIYSDNCLVLVHPYYIRSDRFFNRENKDIKKYFENLDLIKNQRKDLSIILYEDPRHYMRFTHQISEKKIFNKIIFTEEDSGKPLNKSDLYIFYNKNLFVGGSYGDLCVDKFIREVHKEKPKDIIPVENLFINSNFFSETFGTYFSDKIMIYDEDSSEIIKFNAIEFQDFYKRFFL